MIGPITGPDLKGSLADRLALGREKGVTDFIINAQELVAQHKAIVDVLNLPGKEYLKENMDRQSRMAVLVPTDPESVWIAEFYETVCINRGWKVRICSDHASAVRWLLDK